MITTKFTAKEELIFKGDNHKFSHSQPVPANFVVTTIYVNHLKTVKGYFLLLRQSKV